MIPKKVRQMESLLDVLLVIAQICYRDSLEQYHTVVTSRIAQILLAMDIRSLEDFVQYVKDYADQIKNSARDYSKRINNPPPFWIKNSRIFFAAGAVYTPQLYN